MLLLLLLLLLLLTQWDRGLLVQSESDVTYLVIVDRLAAREGGPLLRGTTVWAESMAFLLDDNGQIDHAGLVGVCCLVHHSSSAARAAFERESGLVWGDYQDFICLASIPPEGDETSLGMTLLVRNIRAPCAPL